MLGKLLARFNIKQQILLGFVPALLVLFFMMLSGVKSFDSFVESLNHLETSQTEHVRFVDIMKDIAELQRNTLVYSYVGYAGVLKKIDYLEQNIEDKFVQILENMNMDDARTVQIKDRVTRLQGHFVAYSHAFDDAVEQKKNIKKLYQTKLAPVTDAIMAQNAKDIAQLTSYGSVAEALELSALNTDVMHIHMTTKAFMENANSVVARDIYAKLSQVIEHVEALETRSSNAELFEVRLVALKQSLKLYRDALAKLSSYNSTHLHLMNVVLAGKAAEMSVLAKELDVLVDDHSHVIRQDIEAEVGEASQYYSLLSLLAVMLGVVSIIYVARSIATPVKNMTNTLLALAHGEDVAKIPGMRRRDEVGKMAKAANEFKLMSEQVTMQAQELEEFAYRTSHDLRSPLVSSIQLIKVSKDMLESGKKEKAFQGLELVLESLEKLERLVTDILALTKAKNAEEDITDIDFYDAIESSMKQMAHMEHYDHVHIENLVPKGTVVTSKLSRITLIMENLISNAIKYYDPEKEYSWVRISVEDYGNNVSIRVQDNGLGIPSQYQEKIFGMFKRFHPKTSFGSGLGLYMIKKSAEYVGGSVAYEDTEDGTAFTITIPRSSR